MQASVHSDDVRAIDARWRWAAYALVGAGILIAVVLLVTCHRLPIAPSYSDSVMYTDGKHRIDFGQIPHVDFFSPFGLFPYYAFAVTKSIFPDAQTVLAAQLPILILLGPLLIWIAATSARRGAALVATALFVLFCLTPCNFQEADLRDIVGARGVDGFGIYNRQAGLILYVLAAALWLGGSRAVIITVSAVTLALLFFTKVTAFAAGFALVAQGLLMHRIRLVKWLPVVMAPTVLIAGVLELSTGYLHAYIDDLLTLARAEGGKGNAKWRLIEAARQSPILLAATGLFVLGQLWTARAIWTRVRESGLSDLARMAFDFVRSETAAFLLLVAVAIFIESQNTGSQAYIFVAPAAIALIAADRRNWLGAPALAALVSVMTLLPLNQAARLAFTTYRQSDVVSPELASFGLMADRHELEESMRWIEQNAPATPLWLASQSSEPAPRTGDEPAAAVYQEGEIIFFLVAARGGAAMKGWLEKQKPSDFTVTTLGFVEPISAMLGLRPLTGLPVVCDPPRTVPAQSVAKLDANWSKADGILVPRCFGLDSIIRLGAPALAGRTGQRIDACWDLYLKQHAAQ
jgi:hypothetical protein